MKFKGLIQGGIIAQQHGCYAAIRLPFSGGQDESAQDHKIDNGTGHQADTDWCLGEKTEWFELLAANDHKVVEKYGGTGAHKG